MPHLVRFVCRVLDVDETVRRNKGWDDRRAGAKRADTAGRPKAVVERVCQRIEWEMIIQR